MRIILSRLKGKKQHRRNRVIERGQKPKITRLKPDEIYELQEEGFDWSHAQECKANDKGEIYLHIYSEGFTCITNR